MIDSNILSIALGLASGLTWGAGDFCGGLATKRGNVYSVVVVADVIGGLMLFGLGLVFGETAPPLSAILWGAVAGIFGSIGLLALYQALASGRMGIASPIAAVVTASVPVVFAVFVDGWPRALQMLGFGVALIGVWLLSGPAEARIKLRELVLPTVAGVGFGIFLIIINRVSHEAAFLPLVSARAATVMALGAFAVVTHQWQLPRREDWPLIFMIGVLDAGGNILFAFAGRVGRLDVAAVLSSLYPASTVGLAWLILKERINRWQMIGILAALAAIVLITV